MARLEHARFSQLVTQSPTIVDYENPLIAEAEGEGIGGLTSYWSMIK